VKEASDNTNIVANIGFRTSKLAVEYTAVDYNPDGTQVTTAGAVLDSTIEHKNSLIGLGVNCSHKVNGGTGLVVGGLNFQMASGTWTSEDMENAAGSTSLTIINDGYGSGDELEMKWMGLWANIGVEANLTSWLQVRGGLSHEVIGSLKITETDVSALNAAGTAYQDTDTTETSIDFPEDVVMTFGVGVSHKNWNVDLLVTKDAVEDLLSDANFGEGILYGGNVLDDIVKGQIKYNF